MVIEGRWMGNGWKWMHIDLTCQWGECAADSVSTHGNFMRTTTAASQNGCGKSPSSIEKSSKSIMNHMIPYGLWIIFHRKFWMCHFWSSSFWSFFFFPRWPLRPLRWRSQVLNIHRAQYCAIHRTSRYELYCPWASMWPGLGDRRCLWGRTWRWKTYGGFPGGTPSSLDGLYMFILENHPKMDDN